MAATDFLPGSSFFSGKVERSSKQQLDSLVASSSSGGDPVTNRKIPWLDLASMAAIIFFLLWFAAVIAPTLAHRILAFILS